MIETETKDGHKLLIFDVPCDAYEYSKKHIEPKLFKDALIEMGNVGIQAAKAARLLRNSFHSIAEAEYRKQNGRLPGSERTKRLRKKRHKAVVKWYCEILRLTN